jgi:hypothetical protein
MDQRPSFEEIIPRFDYIIIDGLLPDPMARQLWRDRFLGMTTVSWRAFAEAFSEVIRVPLPKDPRDIKWQCLRRVTADPRDEQQVSLESFAKMLHWFGPLAEPSVLDRIHDLLRERYFHGEISSQEAERRMGGEKKGTFLLRFSSRDLGCYALTVVDGKGALKHYRITHSPGSPYAIGKVHPPRVCVCVRVRCVRVLSSGTTGGVPVAGRVDQALQQGAQPQAAMPGLALRAHVHRSRQGPGLPRLPGRRVVVVVQFSF